VGPALQPSERSSGPAVRIPEELEVAQSAKAPVSDSSCLLLVVATTDNFVKFYQIVKYKKDRIFIFISIQYECFYDNCRRERRDDRFLEEETKSKDVCM
jgi:hypothetical protein